MVDGTEVVEEVIAKGKAQASGLNTESTDQRGPVGNVPSMDGPALGHHDWISSLTLCQANYWYVITGSRDGVIKVWK